ncbi:MAG: hypothetical protein ACREQV_06195, partial [Candidatus Binatia bacterium]
VLCLLGAACGQPPIVQQAPGTIPSSTFPSSQTSTPGGTTPPQPAALPSRAQTNDAYRWAYAMDTANKAAQLGAILGGPFGGPASMGMGVLGLLFGAVTAESRISEENARAQGQYQKETTKDQQLEAAIEQELERQRAFESQIAGTTAAARKDQPATQIGDSAPSANPGGIVVASLNKPVPASATPAAPFKNVEIKDLNNDGIADLWIYYNPQKLGEVLRQEEASELDGRVDTWSYFKDGRLVRRDVDNHGHGRPDRVYYYDDQKIVREERDETGQGRMTYRADYEDGRVAKVERATRGNGRADLWITYDMTSDGEVVLKEERDLNGDGFPDLWSHYDRGRLVRRDVNAIGLELFSKQEEAPLHGSAGGHRSHPGS